MRVLWLCNIAIPEVSEQLSLKASNRGGWLTGYLNGIRDSVQDVFLVFPCEKTLETTVNGLHCFGFSQTIREEVTALSSYFEQVLKKTKPDIIHIHGTEYLQSYAMMQVCGEKGLAGRAVISIQGLVSVIAEHYCAGLPEKVLKKQTLRDVVKRDSIEKRAAALHLQGEYEQKTLRAAKHVIGRTEWDKACVFRINPKLQYHHCGEILREPFYHQSAWNSAGCEKHTVFVAQGNSPLKGFHQMLAALTELMAAYPDVLLYTTGSSPLTENRKTRLRQTYYQKYLADQIQARGLKEHIIFLGDLNAQQMCEQYLRANAFALCSSIENSPNSLGEAMLLGVPSIAANVGGMSSLLAHGSEGFLYPFDEAYMLAYDIRRIFEDDGLAAVLSENARRHAYDCYDPIKNSNDLLAVYKEMFQ